MLVAFHHPVFLTIFFFFLMFIALTLYRLNSLKRTFLIFSGNIKVAGDSKTFKMRKSFYCSFVETSFECRQKKNIAHHRDFSFVLFFTTFAIFLQLWMKFEVVLGTTGIAIRRLEVKLRGSVSCFLRKNKVDCNFRLAFDSFSDSVNIVGWLMEPRIVFSMEN